MTRDNTNKIEKSTEDDFDEFEHRFKKQHPFYYFFNEQMKKVFGDSPWFMFGYSFHVLIDNPRIYLDELKHQIKWAYQRVVYGVDDRASWGVGGWLIDVMPVVLSKIKGSKYGVPFRFYDDEDLLDTSGFITEKAHTSAEEKYDFILNQIREGFEEMKKLDDGEWVEVKEYKRIEKEAKKKISLLVDYFWEIGD